MGSVSCPTAPTLSSAPRRSPDRHVRSWAPKASGRSRAHSLGGVVSEHLHSRKERGTFPFLSFPIQREGRIFSAPWSRSIASLFKEDPQTWREAAGGEGQSCEGCIPSALAP